MPSMATGEAPGAFGRHLKAHMAKHGNTGRLAKLAKIGRAAKALRAYVPCALGASSCLVACCRRKQLLAVRQERKLLKPL